MLVVSRGGWVERWVDVLDGLDVGMSRCWIG
jgi:hypothetical protein